LYDVRGGKLLESDLGLSERLRVLVVLHDSRLGLLLELELHGAHHLRLRIVRQHLCPILWVTEMFSKKSTGVLAIAFTTTVLVLACSDNSSSNSSQNCPIGSEGCPCTTGGGCDVGLVCYDPICFKPDATAAGGVGAASGTGGGAGASAGGAGGVSNGGTGGVSNGGTSSGGTSSGGGSATCPFPGKVMYAPLVGDPAGTSKDKLLAEFSNGTLVKLDGKTCTLNKSAPALAGDWSTYPCHDAYDCGGCLVYVISPSNAAATGDWFLIGAFSGTYGATAGCPDISGNYTVCAPDCAGKTCGGDGCNGSCGACGKEQCCNQQDKCVNDTCASCLDSCKGLPSCCQGAGCICDSACPGPC